MLRPRANLDLFLKNCTSSNWSLTQNSSLLFNAEREQCPNRDRGATIGLLVRLESGEQVGLELLTAIWVHPLEDTAPRHVPLLVPPLLLVGKRQLPPAKAGGLPLTPRSRCLRDD